MKKMLILLSGCFCLLEPSIASQEQSSLEKLSGSQIMNLIQQKSKFDYENLSKELGNSILSLQEERKEKSSFSEVFKENIDKAFNIFDRFVELSSASEVDILRNLWKDTCLITNDGFYDISNISISILKIEEKQKGDLIRYLDSLNGCLWQTRELVSWKLAQTSGDSDVIVDLGGHLLSSCLFRTQFEKKTELIQDILISWGCKNSPQDVKQAYAIDFDSSDAMDEDDWIIKTGAQFSTLLEKLN